MRDVVAFEKRGEYSTCAKRVWVERDENENGRRERMIRLREVAVEVRDEVPW